MLKSKERERSPIQSMTGFAAAEGPFQNDRIKIEVKSVNHRTLDARVRLPRELTGLETPIKADLQSRFSRGSFDVSAEFIETPNAQPKKIALNAELAAQYVSALRDLRDRLKLSGDVETRDLLQFPDLFNPRGSSQGSKDQWEAFSAVFSSAAEALKTAREQEAERLTQALLLSVKEIRSTFESIVSKRASAEPNARKKTKDRIQKLFEVYPVASQPVQTLLETRVAQELALILDRTDIEEERVRFLKHLDHLESILESEGLVGRKIDFTLQEMNREINTLGNKAQDYGISEEVVRVKVRIEQIREQAMNLE